MKSTCKLKILAVGNEQRNITTKQTTRKVVLTVADVSADNPFGHTKPTDNSFEVEVYNHNIETFGIKPVIIDQVADAELVINFYKASTGPAQPKFIVNDLSFRI